MTVSLKEAREASDRILDAAERLADFFKDYDEADAMDLRERTRRGLVEDIEAEMVFIRRKLEFIEKHTEREKTTYGW